MASSGYPGFIIYIILFCGLSLAMVRPFYAFLFAVFVISAADNAAFTLTRLDSLGPYFNAHDACFVVALAAIFFYGVLKGRRIRYPWIVKWMFVALTIGFVQSLIGLKGHDYEILRALRWALSLPVYMVIAATMVDDERKVSLFLVILFAGSLFSALEHIFVVHAQIMSDPFYNPSPDEFRTITFRGAGLWFALSAIVWKPHLAGKKKAIYFAGLLLFVISLLLNQTRSVWISSITAVPVLYAIFPQNRIWKRAVAGSLSVIILYFVVTGAMRFLTPNVGPLEIIMDRVNTLADEDLRYSTTETRQSSLELELNEWRESTYVFGRGLYYYADIYYDLAHGRRVAWGHLGHVTTLAQLGIVGLFIFSVLFPISVIKNARSLWREASEGKKELALVAGACMVSSWICFFMSDSFLTIHSVEGVIFGVAWRQAALLKPTEDRAYLSQRRGLPVVRWQ